MPDKKPALRDKTDAPASVSPYNSARLDEIRRRIDELDDSIHDSLMERAELVLEVGREKKKNNIQIVQPAREARMIRRLLGRHKGVLPEMAVVRIWRELVGAVSLLQTGLRVSVAVPDGQHEYYDLARDYFGSCLPTQKAVSALSAVSALKEGRATFAVLPRPSVEDENPWWAYLDPTTAEPLSIIACLPHGVDPANPNPGHAALVVSKSGFDSSGDDNSFVIVTCDATISRGRIIDTAKTAKLEPLGLYSKRTASPSAPSVHLMELRDYVVRDDKRLKAFLKALDDNTANAFPVGGYPVPPSYAKSVRPAEPEIPALPKAAS